MGFGLALSYYRSIGWTLAPTNQNIMNPVQDQAVPTLAGEKFFTAPLLVIFLIVFIDLIGFGMVIPILPYYALHEPFLASPFEIGLIVSVYSWMQFLFAPMLGSLSDRYGRRPVLFISLLGSAIGYVIIGLAATIALVVLGRIVSGITGANISAAQAYIADVTSKENRAKGMAMFGAAFGLGFILGPGLAGILSKFSIQLPFFVAAGLSTTSAAAVYFFLPESRSPNQVDEGPRGLAAAAMLFRERAFAFVNIVYFLLVTSFSIMTYAFVLYTSVQFGYDAEQNGYLFFFVGIIAVLGQGVLFGRLVNAFGESALTAAGCLLMAASLFLIPLVGPASGGLPALLGVCVLLSLGNALASPSLTGLGSKVSHADRQGSSLGVMQSGASLARAVGPMIGGVLLSNATDQIDERTIYRTFWAASGIMVAALLIAVYFALIFEKEARSTVP